MNWGEWFMIFVPGVITGAAITLTILRPWRTKITIEAEETRC